MARDPSLITKILRGYLQVIFTWQRHRARTKGLEDPRCGAATFVQRFGGFLNLNVPFHAVLPDGVFVMDESQKPRFRQLDPLTNEEVAALTEHAVSVSGRPPNRRVPRLILEVGHGAVVVAVTASLAHLVAEDDG